jgi:hypothetical protein
VRTKGKYEDAFYFEDLAKKKTKHRSLQELQRKLASFTLFPFHLPDDTFDVLRESRTRQRIISEAKRLYEDWRPAQRVSTLSRPTPLIGDEVLKEIQRLIAGDWPQSKFLLAINPRGQIEAVFDVATIENLSLLTVYMNALVSDARISQYQLRRCVE